MRYIASIKVLSVLLFLPLMAYGASDKGDEVAANKEDVKEKSKKGNFAQGAKLWSRNCASCHNMRDPKDFNDRGWEMVIMHMRVRAGLTGQDARDISAFLKRSN